MLTALKRSLALYGEMYNGVKKVLVKVPLPTQPKGQKLEVIRKLKIL